MNPQASATSEQPDPGLAWAIKSLALAGLALVLLFPAARGHGDLLGWGPLWLVGMPLAAWWALNRFRLPWQTARPDLRSGLHVSRRPRRSRLHAQARRCGRPARQGAQAKAA